ncbi:hypothetical protein KVT40_005337 [Elsinoe batatas]|uniref:AB hydrolase-1 domain-containing protein n=1 Tax=Elsinoe batatas TaxID=2601811 RepID=A0A8K0KZP5_9PEZI|nr:hypothetical protein KVT40_005337 [Elsinoe batatas]
MIWKWFLDLFAGSYAGSGTASASREVDNRLLQQQAKSIVHAIRIEDWSWLLSDILFAKGFDLIRLTAGLILSGSGPCDVDSTVGANKPLKDLSLGLVKCNVASIRFEKVTFAHGMRIRDGKNFTLTEEYVPHALAAVRHAVRHPHVNNEAIVIVGHSLGAYITPKLASLDDSIRKCVLLACPARPVYYAAIGQFEYFAAMDDPSGQQPQPQIEELRKQAELADSPHLNRKTPAKDLPFGLCPAYWLDCRNYNPLQDLTSCQKPILCLQGGRDYQVTSEDFDALIDSVEDKSSFKYILYEDLNHLFISGRGPPTPLEYGTPGNVAEAVILEVARWCHDDSADVDALFGRV